MRHLIITFLLGSLGCASGPEPTTEAVLPIEETTVQEEEKIDFFLKIVRQDTVVSEPRIRTWNEEPFTISHNYSGEEWLVTGSWSRQNGGVLVDLQITNPDGSEKSESRQLVYGVASSVSLNSETSIQLTASPVD